MKIAIISGSHRVNSQSGRIVRIIESRAKDRGFETDVIDLTNNPLPLWDEGVWDKTERWQKLWQPYAERLKSSSGLVVVSPEWHGMAPAGLKNFFLLCGGTRLIAHKPAYIVAVSSGMGGSYPVAELRMSSYKNTRLCYLPEQLIIRHCEQFLQNPAQPTESDQKYLARLDYGLAMLKEYAAALAPIAPRMADFEKTFPNGM